MVMTGSTDSRQRTGERTGARTASALLGVCIGIAVAIGPAGALADQTAIQQNPNELSLDAPGGILDQLYGLANLTRVEDSAFVPNDQIWLQVTSGSATAQARFASLTHRFGYFDGASATFTQLFEVSGPSPGILDPPGPMALFAPAGPTFRFGLQEEGARRLVEEALTDLASFQERAEPLQELARYLLIRRA